MNKKTIRIISTLLTVTIVLMVLTTSAFALAPNEIKPSTNAAGVNEIKSLGGNIMAVVQTAGVVIAVVIVAVLGIKYMMGSASEKAEYKKTMIPYIVGAVLIFGASTIANVVYQFADSL